MNGDRQDKRKDTAYYRLHTKAVDELVGANSGNTPQYSQEELDRYRSKRAGISLPAALKTALIKAWFYGAVCYFVFWGLGLYVRAQLDLFAIAAVIMGMVTDLLINVLLRFLEKREGESGAYIMVTKRGVPGLLLNLLYGGVLLFLVVTVYGVINMVLGAGGGENAPFLGVEPVLFGVLCALCDALLIGGRRLLARIVSDAKSGSK